MKKRAIIIAISFGLLLGGCGNKQNTESRNEDFAANNATVNVSIIDDETEAQEEREEPVTVVQGGPYGQLSLSVPKGWKAEACPVDSAILSYGMYGIRFYPEDVSGGCIELSYVDSFGVCGTGLVSENAVIAGENASIGTYDGNEYWSFINFSDENIIAQTYSVSDWWSEYGSQVLEILDTMSFDNTIKEGGAYVYSKDSEADKIALQLSVENVSPTSVTLVFNQYDKEAPDGKLQFGDAFVLEQRKNGEWEELPVVVEGKYAFHQVAYTIGTESETKKELDWEWLYGALLPGEYRIKKTVDDFRGSGDFDEYTIYAEFILT